MKVKIKKFYDDAIIPKYQTKGAACFDFCAHLDKPVTIPAGGIESFGTGVGAEIPVGYELQVRSRSGLAYKNHVSMLNGIGVIDSDYRGEIHVLLKNHGTKDFVVEPGMRIAQGMFAPAPQITWEEVDELSETERSTGGFGSTGVK